MNPFFEERQVFDYNPGMLRQFREWLRGSGPYAGDTRDGAPDLSAYRRPRPLTLAQVNAMARAHWRTWDEVQPPRRLPGMHGPALKPGERAIWTDPWWQAWEHFRKHVVDLHYDELSRVGEGRRHPGRSDLFRPGVHGPRAGVEAVRAESREHRPELRFGGRFRRRCGAALRASRRSDLRTRRAQRGDHGDGSLDVRGVRAHVTGLGRRRIQPDGPAARQRAADLQRRRIARCATCSTTTRPKSRRWRGTAPTASTRTSRATCRTRRGATRSGEDAMRDFLVSHSDLPRGAQLWTFGSAMHADADGWSAVRGRAVPGNGYLELAPEDGRVTLLSPADLFVRTRRIASVELRLAGDSGVTRATVYARTGARQPVAEGGERGVLPACPSRGRGNGCCAMRTCASCGSSSSSARSGRRRACAASRSIPRAGRSRARASCASHARAGHRRRARVRSTRASDRRP